MKNLSFCIILSLSAFLYTGCNSGVENTVSGYQATEYNDFAPKYITDRGHQYKDYAVMLTIKNCSGCKAMYSVIKDIRQMGYLVYVFDVSTKQFSDLAEGYSVNRFPTIIIYKGGKEFDRVVGPVSEAWFKDMQTLEEQEDKNPKKLPIEYDLF